MTDRDKKFHSLIAQTDAFRQLKSDADSGKLLHAYAIISPDRLAAKTLCLLFMAYAISGGDPYSAIGKRVFSGSYLDVLWFPRVASDGAAGDKLSVSDVDYLADTAFVLPAELSEKWIVLCSSEPISEAVQNKLLKTLEEPPAHTRFIICAGGDNELLPTVMSRCRVVTCDDCLPDIIRAELMRYYPDKAQECEFAAACCGGRIGIAERMVTDPKYKDMYEEAMTTLKTVQRSPQIAHRAQMWLVHKDFVGCVIDFLQLILRDVLCVNCGCEHLAGVQSRLGDLKELAADFTSETIIKVMPVFDRAKRRLRLYGNLNSVVDELLFSILEVKAQCKK